MDIKSKSIDIEINMTDGEIIHFLHSKYVNTENFIINIILQPTENLCV